LFKLGYFGHWVPPYYAQAAFDLTQCIFSIFPVYFVNKHFCARTRIWCHIIYRRRYIEQHINYLWNENELPIDEVNGKQSNIYFENCLLMQFERNMAAPSGKWYPSWKIY